VDIYATLELWQLEMVMDGLSACVALHPVAISLNPPSIGESSVLPEFY
jgi:hypothetical protein